MNYHEPSLQEDIFLEGTDLLPSVTFMREVSLRIEGRIIPGTTDAFFRPLITWIRNLSCNKVILDVDIEYMNSDASVHLYKMLKTLNDNLVVQHIIVFWHYECDDEEHYEMGKIMAEKLDRIKFFYKSYVK